MRNNPFEQLVQANTETEINQLQERVQAEGYSTFRRILEGLKDQIKQFEEDQVTEMEELIEKAKKAFPNPGSFSPSWEHIWQELEQHVIYKAEIFRKIPKEERTGEWQVLLDNPYTSQEVVCYPGLTFIEAAYLYGYFRPQLEKNEYMRIQKIQNMILEFGS